MINKVFKNNNNKFSMFLASLGSIIGLTLLFLSLQLYMDFRLLLSGENELMSSEFLIVKKEVSDLSILGINNSFSEKEIQEIADQSFVKSLAVFKGCQYQVFAHLSSDGGKFPGFSTLAYFESVPDEFIDVTTNNWAWDTNNIEIPVILPNTYIDAYNFGIALSMGTPQLSEKLLTSIPFKLTLQGNNKKGNYFARVISFSDRINSILVPENFLNYTNKLYGNKETTKHNKVIIATNDLKNPAVSKFLEEHRYTTNSEKTRENKIQSILNNGVLYQFIIGLIIITQSIILFIFYARIIINKSDFEIKTLLMLGYNRKTISVAINKLFIRSYLIVFTLSFTLFISAKSYFYFWLKNNKGIELNSGINVYTVLIALLFILSIITINKLNINRRLKTASAE